MSDADIKEIGIRGHSFHGTMADYATAIGAWPLLPFPYVSTLDDAVDDDEQDEVEDQVGAQAGVDRGFTEDDVDAFGYWLSRGKRKPQRRGKGRGRSGRGGTSGGRGGGSNDTAGAGGMGVRYSRGKNRIGDRKRQLRIRRRMIEYIARALRNWCAVHNTTWRHLPHGLADTDILTDKAATVKPIA